MGVGIHQVQFRGMGPVVIPQILQVVIVGGIIMEMYSLVRIQMLEMRGFHNVTTMVMWMYIVQNMLASITLLMLPLVTVVLHLVILGEFPTFILVVGGIKKRLHLQEIAKPLQKHT